MKFFIYSIFDKKNIKDVNFIVRQNTIHSIELIPKKSFYKITYCDNKILNEKYKNCLYANYKEIDGIKKEDILVLVNSEEELDQLQKDLNI